MEILPDEYYIHQLAPNSPIPEQVFGDPFFSLTQTKEELSLVCNSRISVDSKKAEGGFACMQIVGVLDFSETGILAEISSILSQAEISIFAVSTFNTDYILFKNKKIEIVKESLRACGHQIDS